MKMLLTDFKPVFRKNVLDLLWSQWTTSGISGYGREWHGSPIDPEALIITTCTIARHDARLFDAMLEWMSINGRYINVQRLKKIIKTEEFSGEQVFKAVAATTKTSTSTAKWRKITDTIEMPAAPSALFYLKDDSPMPIVGKPDAVFAEYGLLRDDFKPRGVAVKYPPFPTENLLLRLRALFGVNARCEIMANLLLKGLGSPRLLARETYYFPATITKAMSELRDTGFVISKMDGRRRFHKLVPNAWNELFLGDSCPVWIVWPRVFSALESIWNFLSDEDLQNKTTIAQASSIRRLLLNSVIDKLETCGLDFSFGNISHSHGEQLIPVFTERINAFFSILSSPDFKQPPVDLNPKLS